MLWLKESKAAFILRTKKSGCFLIPKQLAQIFNKNKITEL